MRIWTRYAWQWRDGVLVPVPEAARSYEYEGPLALCTAMVAYAQNAYRFYEDGAENTSTALGSQDTALSRDVTADSNIQLRIRIQETGGANGATTDDYRLQRNIAGAGFGDVTTTSTGVKGFNSASLTDAGTTTQRLTNGTGSFVAGEIAETGLVTDRQVTASNYMELLYSLTLVAAELSNGQAVTFRVLVNGNTMTYNVTPTLNVTKAGGGPLIGGGLTKGGLIRGGRLTA